MIHPPGSITLVATLSELLHSLNHRLVLRIRRPAALTLAIPVIGIATGTQEPTHHVDWPGLLMLGNERILPMRFLDRLNSPKKGQSLSEIGRALGKHAGSITGMLAIHGGIAPPGRSRSARVFNTGEREEISRGLSAGLSLSQVADQIRRSTSTVSREIHHNGGRSEYRANLADQRAWMQYAQVTAQQL